MINTNYQFPQEKYKAIMDKVEKYADLYGLPSKLEDAMKMFYTFQYKKKVGSEEEVGNELCFKL